MEPNLGTGWIIWWQEIARWDSVSPIILYTPIDHLHIFVKLLLHEAFILPSNGLSFSCFSNIPLSSSSCASPILAPILIHNNLFYFLSLGRAICPHLVLTLWLNFYNYNLLIIDLMPNIHMEVNTSYICLSGSGLLHTGWFFLQFQLWLIKFTISFFKLNFL